MAISTWRNLDQLPCIIGSVVLHHLAEFAGSRYLLQQMLGCCVSQVLAAFMVLWLCSQCLDAVWKPNRNPFRVQKYQRTKAMTKIKGYIHWILMNHTESYGIFWYCLILLVMSCVVFQYPVCVRSGLNNHLKVMRADDLKWESEFQKIWAAKLQPPNKNLWEMII